MNSWPWERHDADFSLKALAAKRHWQNMRNATGKPFDRPNIVMSDAVQVCFE
jgi:glutamate decarboxylase